MSVTQKKLKLSTSSKIGKEEEEMSDFFLEKFIALNPLYYIDESEEDDYANFGFSTGLKGNNFQKSL